jgi:DNA-binding winged helix-turn-helix (wHTH) protein
MVRVQRGGHDGQEPVPHMISESQFSATLHSIYDAGLDFQRWPLVMEGLADILGASMTCLVKHDLSTSAGDMITVRTDPDTPRVYAEHYAKVNVLAQRAGARPAATCMTDRSVLTRDELFRSEFYTDFLRPRDVHSILSVFLMREGATRIAFGRPHRAGDWQQPQIDCLNRFAPHLHRAAEMNIRLGGVQLAHDLEAAVLDCVPQGVLIVDRKGLPLFANSRADRILAEADGLNLDGKGLSAAAADEHALLCHLVTAAGDEGDARNFPANVRISRPSMRTPLSLMIVPLRREGGWFLSNMSGAIILMSGDADDGAPIDHGDVAPSPLAGRMAGPKIFQFGAFRLDADNGVLFRGTEPVRLGKRAIALLGVLLEQAPALVSKSSLLDAAWGSRAVEESNLTVQIAALRKALGDEGEANWIETWPHRGYRFAGPFSRG